MLSHESLARFKQNSWRKQAEVFKAAIDVTAFSLSINELGKLATNDKVESRLIDSDYHLEFGPFELDADKGELLPEQSMLMIQSLEQHLPQIDAMIRRHFDFMPRWQIDDVMVTFGNADASCGAHFDQYDVFLVQHTGQKVWQLDDGGHTESELSQDADVRLLDHFTPSQTFTLEPGDVLYIPPGMGHFGQCPDTSITLSVGIRHPTPAELLADLSAFALEQLDGNEPMTSGLFNDESLPQSAFIELQAGLDRALGLNVLDRWYGSFVTQLKEPEILEDYIPDNPPAFLGSAKVSLPTRLAWRSTENATLLFVNGEVFELMPADETWVAVLCVERGLSLTADKIDVSISETGRDCISDLITAGALQIS